MTSLQVSNRTWEIIREEGAVIEEALEDDNSLCEKVDENVTSSVDAIVGTSFDEKSGGLDGYQAGVVDIRPGDHPSEDEDGQGSL